jgi:peptide/nickel transport system permease protein
MFVVLLVVSFLVFVLLAFVPGDPAIQLAGGLQATPERIAKVREQLGENDRLVVQFGRWLGGAGQGVLGK